MMFKQKSKLIINKILKKIGYEISKISHYSDMEAEFKEIFKKCKPYTMTSIERMYSLYKAVEYVIKNNIEGDFVECGVWKGGSCMLYAIALLKMNAIEKNIFLYDTYEGMSKPTIKDSCINGTSVSKIFSDSQAWCDSSLEEVKTNMFSTGYPKDKLKFIKGKVEDTIPDTIPEKISILRLDTDWYDSTYHELVHLYPKLSLFGILLLDDYGYWKGVKNATDKYIKENNIRILLQRIDQLGRIGIKLTQ